MKALLVLMCLGLSFTAFSQEEYEPNSGRYAPGTFTSPNDGDQRQEEQTAHAEEDFEVSTDDMNTSPNPTPEQQESDNFNQTLNAGEINPGDSQQAEEAEAQDEEVIDYSTLPAEEE
jgi:hypothetical protein